MDALDLNASRQSRAGIHVGPIAEGVVTDAQTRRALIASAVGGIDRFKKSWMSVMLLKLTIGLGQVSHPHT